MKSTLFKAMAIIMGMMMSLSLASCGDDNDEPEPEDPKAVEFYQIEYLADVSEDYLNFFDVSMIYVNEVGKVQTQVLGKDMSVVSFKIPANLTPDKIDYKIHVTRKATLPAIDPDKNYIFKVTGQIKVNEVLKDGTAGSFVGGNSLPIATQVPIHGSSLETYIEKHKDSDIFNCTVTIKK